MSLLAGYDMVTEIGAAALGSLFRNSLRLDGRDLVTPFELERPFDAGGVDASFRMIVNAVTVDLRTGAPIVLELGFHHASATLGASGLCPLDGVITIATTPAIVTRRNDDGASVAALSLPMRDAGVDIRFSDYAEGVIASGLQGAAIPPDAFKARAVAFFSTFVRSQPDPSFDLGFQITGDARGSITPNISYSALEAHCLGGEDRARQSLALAGYLFPENRGRGRPGEIDLNTAAASQIAVAMTPQAFRTFVFCPGIARSFQNKKREAFRSFFPDDLPVDPAEGIVVLVSDLPTACGGASEIEVSGAEISKVEDTFEDGYIRVDVAFKYSHAAFTADGTASNKMRLSIVGGEIKPEIEIGEPDVDLDLKAWTYLTGYAALGLFGLTSVRIAEAVGEGVADKRAVAELNKSLGGDLASTRLGAGLGDLRPDFNDVAVTRDGLLLTGRGTVRRRGGGDPDVRLVQLSVEATTTLAEEGVWETKIFCEAAPDKFPWKAFAQTQVVTLRPNSVLMPPLRTRYTLIAAGSKLAELTGASGTAVLRGVLVDYLLPFGSGGSQVMRDVEVGYVVSGDEVRLTNRPEDGNFVVTLRCRYADCAGRPIPGQPGESSSMIHFDGQLVEIGNDYAARLGACLVSKGREAQRIADKIREQLGAMKTPIDLVDPAPDDMRTILDGMVSAGMPGVARFIAVMRTSAASGRVTRALEAKSALAARAPALREDVETLAGQLEAMASALRKGGTL